MLVVLWFVVVAHPAWAATVSISGGLTTLEALQTTRIQVVVTGTDRAAAPEIAPVDGLAIRYVDRRSQYTNTPSTGIVRSTTFGYTVQPLRAGSFTIGPVEVPLRNGDVLTTGSLTITAKPRGTTPVEKEAISVTAAFERDTVWEGEVVVYEAEVKARTRVQSVRWSLPAFTGLTRPPHGGDVQRVQEVIGDPDGDITLQRYRMPLLATGTGDRTQAPAVAQVSSLTAERQVFGRRTRRSTVAAKEPAPLTVRPLPPGASDFTGLVGDFELQSRLRATEAEVGEDVDWVVMVAGDGVVDGFDLALPEVEGVRFYPDETETHGRLTEDGYVASKVFRIKVVPTQPGVLEMPPLELRVFSPSKGAYTVLSQPLPPLTVTGEADGGVLRSFGSADEVVEVAEPELVGVYRWGFATLPPFAPWMPVLFLVVSLPGGMVLVGEGGGSLRGWWRARRAAAGRTERGAERLKSLPDGADRLAVLDLALREGLADSVGSTVGALRREEALDTLPDDLAHRVRNAFGALDRCRFAGEAPGPEIEQMVKDALGRLA